VRERDREREMGICNVNLEKEQCWVGVVGMCLQVTKYTQASEIEEKPRDGCYITGLYLEGASWDEKISMLRVQVQRPTHTHTHTHTTNTQQTHKIISKVNFFFFAFFFFFPTQQLSSSLRDKSLASFCL
jgi:hypothetical protein